MNQPRDQGILRFYFDYISHNAYLAWSRLDDLSQRYGLEIELVPILFAGLLKAHGQLGPAEIPAKSSWMTRDVIRKAAIIGLPLAPPPAHPFNPLLALRVTCATTNRQHRASLVKHLFEGVWARSRDVSDPAMVKSIAAEAGLDGDELVELAGARETKQRLIDNTESAIQAGAFGVPTMLIANQLFWGYDDLRYLEMFLRGEDPLCEVDFAPWLAIRSGTTRKR